MFLNTLILLVLIIFVYLYRFYKNVFLFFEKRNIAYVKPRAIFGNLGEVIFKKKTLFELHAEIYEKLKSHKIGGFFNFHEPSYIVCDPELIKYIAIKNFEHFTDRIAGTTPEDSFGTTTLTFMNGERWKNLRIKLTPTFSSGKLKMMFPLIKACGDNFARVLERFTPDEEIEFKDLWARYTTDLTATCAFGLESNTLENPKSDLYQLSRQVVEGSFLGFVLSSIPNIPPKLAKIIDSYISNQKTKKCYYSMVLETIKYRETNNIVRNDFLDLLIGLKNNSDINKFEDENDAQDLKRFLSEIGNKHNTSDVEMTDGVLVDQVFFFLATSLNLISSVLSSSLLELALNLEIQDKVRAEITTVLKSNGGELTYEVTKEMKYTDMVIAEALRKHPSSAALFRKCTSNYKVPGTEIIIRKGESLVVPTYGLHMDKTYYERPNEFYPEHFTKEAIAKRPYFSYLPFGTGPRMCIASRFSKMNLKLSLVFMLKTHSFSVSPRTKLPIQYAKKAQRHHLLEVEGGVWLKCKKI